MSGKVFLKLFEMIKLCYIPSLMGASFKDGQLMKNKFGFPLWPALLSVSASIDRSIDWLAPSVFYTLGIHIAKDR